MLRSTFCLCPLGWALWSPRIAESVLAGCIPVIIADSIRLPFDSALNWRTFSVKVSEELVRDGQLKQILMGISAASVRKKQRALASVRTAMDYTMGDIQSTGKGALHHVLSELRARVHEPKLLVSHSSDIAAWV